MIERIIAFSVALFIAPATYSQAPVLERMDIVLKSLPDGPVARVEGTSIGRQEFARLYEAELQRVSREGGLQDLPDEARAQLAMSALRMLVERALLYNEAIDRELTVPEKFGGRCGSRSSGRGRCRCTPRTS